MGASTLIERSLIRCRTEHYVVASLGKTLNANFPSNTLWTMEDKHKCVFYNGIYWRK